MLVDIVEVKPIDGHRLWLRFEDGLEGEVDVSALVPFEGVFSSIKTEKDFCKVFVDREIGTIRWPSGADLDPDVLYAAISGEHISARI